MLSRVESEKVLFEPRHGKPDFCICANKGADQL